MKPERIVVLGGGLASLVCAAELTAPHLRGRYEVTVLQRGWRLGGKAASGVGRWGRVEEHGLHVWFGYYQNAFALMREVYEELGRPSSASIATVDDAFTPVHAHTFFEAIDGEWSPWRFDFDGSGEVPGRKVGGRLPNLPGLVPQTRRMVAWWRMVFADHPSLQVERRHNPHEPSGPSDPFADVLLELGTGVVARWGRRRRALAVRSLKHLRERARRSLPGADTGSRRTRILLDLTLTGMLGLIEDEVASRGYASIDDHDLRDWLRGHGAADEVVDSTVVRTVYDIMFAYEAGDFDRPRIAAGAALQGLLRLLFGYHGAVLFKMNAGMGDAIIAPLYEVLRRRGVRFEFFHDVRALRLSDDKRSVARVEVDRQVVLKVGAYQPLVRVGDLPCWPNEPLWEQLDTEFTGDPEDLERADSGAVAGTLELVTGRDYDRLVLGIPVGALRSLCGELIAARPEWRDLVDNLATVRTQALQLWFAQPQAEVGATPSGMAASYVQPFSSWSDFTQVLAHENWPSPAPQYLAYSCGVLGDEADPSAVRQTAIDWLEQHCAPLWPSLATEQGFDWSGLVDPEERAGSARIDAQYVRANVDGSARYVQSLPGTTRYRLRADASGYDNLVLTGDWTRNGIDLGCVEATVVSGMLAAQAVRGVRERIAGVADVRGDYAT